MKRIRILSVLAAAAMLAAMLALCVGAQTKTSTYDLSGIFESSTCGKGTISFVYGTDAAPAALVADPSSLIRLDKLKTEFTGDFTAPNWMTGKMYKSSDASDTYAHFLKNADNGFAYILPQAGVFNAIVFTAPAAGDYSYTLTANSIWDASDCDVQVYSGTKQLQEVTLNKGANSVVSAKASRMENGDKLYFFFVHTGNANSDIRIDKLVITGVTEVVTEKPEDTTKKSDDTTAVPDTQKTDDTTGTVTETGEEVTTGPETVTTGAPAGETTAEETTGAVTTAEKDTDAPDGTGETTGAPVTTGGSSSGDREETNPLLWAVIALFAALLAAVVVIIVLLKKLKSK